MYWQVESTSNEGGTKQKTGSLGAPGSLCVSVLAKGATICLAMQAVVLLSLYQSNPMSNRSRLPPT
jgi:hypothetical protein